MKIKKKIKYNVVLKYLTLFFVCLCFANADVYGINPFLFAFFFACLFVGVNEKLISGFVLFSQILVLPNLESFLTALTVVAVGLVCFYFHKFFKKRITLALILMYYLVSLVTYFYYHFNNVSNLVSYVLLGVICLFVFIVVLQVLLLRQNCFKLTLDESVCFMFAIAVLGLSLAGVNIGEVKLYKIIILFALLLCVAVGSQTLTFSIVISFCFGVAIYFENLAPLAECVVVALLVGIFKMPNKLKMSAMMIVACSFVDYFFFNQTIKVVFDILPAVIACIAFVLMPNKIIGNISQLVYVKNSEISSRNLINTTRRNIKKRMCELSNVFFDMKQLHLNMLKKELTKDELISMLRREITTECCKNCLEKNRCSRSIGTDNKSNLDVLLDVAVTKGKINLLDIPSSLTNRCEKVNNLVSLINKLCEEYRQYKSVMADVNNVKILLADQMGAVSQLLLNLGDEIDGNVRFDVARENKIIADLLAQNIQCNEVLLYTEKQNDISAEIIVKTNNAYNSIIEKAVSKVLKTPMQINKIVPIDDGDFSSVCLNKKNRFDCMFGLATCNKSGNEECGDCHSIIRLQQNKFLLALCDGMGSGKKANQMSAMTLGLIENFYKAGFNNEIILESVNKLLAISNQESYSTLDVCLLDLENQVADFVKVGAPFGIIKRKDRTEVVEGGTLPIGALDSITPVTLKTALSTQDLVFLVTDGIVDAFGEQDNFVEFVSTLAGNNPQMLADSILAEALAKNQMLAKDDMTVLVARTFLKNN